MYNAPYQGVANQLSQYGRFGDSQLVHLNPAEVKMLASMSPTGQLTRNPMTGQPEAFLPFLAPLLGSFLGSSLLTGAGAGLLGAAGLSSAAAGAIGSGLATAAATGDLEQGIMSGITGFGIGSALGAAGNAAAKAGTDVATQGATQAATDAATTFSPAAAASTMNPLAADTTLQSAIQNAPSSFSPGMAGAQMASAPNFAGISPIQPPAPTSAGLSATQRMAAPFQQPGAFIKQLSSPGSFLPAYVGETSRMAREQAMAGQGSSAEFEQNQENEKNRIRGQMGDVFGSIRKAYPGVGYSQGGIVSRYFEGGTIDQQIADALKTYNQNIPDAKDVQLSLRGQYARTPPAASYSALDVGGEGYLPGVAPEFKYFTDVNPNAPATSTRPAAPGDVGFEPGPVVPPYVDPFSRPYVDTTGRPVDQIIPDYGSGFDVTSLEDLINRGGGNYNAAPPVDTPVQPTMPEVSQPPSYPDLQDLLNGGNYGGYFPEYSQPAPVMSEPTPTAPSPIAPIPPVQYWQPVTPSQPDELLSGQALADVFSKGSTGWFGFRGQGEQPPLMEQPSLENDMYYFNPADDVPLPPMQQPPYMEQPSLENDMYYFNPENDVPAPAPVTPYTPPQSESDIQSEYEKLLESLSEYGGTGGGERGGRFDRNDYQEFAEGGMTQMPEMPMGGQNDIVSMTVAAIRGEAENADEIISIFVEQYGPEAFMQLREQVLQEIVPGAQTQGMVEGMGGGQDDKVMGMIGSQRPVAVSPGEYIIPADAVALAGGGYSGDGASFFDGLVDDIRRKTMGSTKQVKPYR